MSAKEKPYGEGKSETYPNRNEKWSKKENCKHSIFLTRRLILESLQPDVRYRLRGGRYTEETTSDKRLYRLEPQQELRRGEL